METILIVATTLIVALLIILAVPGVFLLVGLYKAARAGQHSTPDKLRWMANKIEGSHTYTITIDGANLTAAIRRHERRGKFGA